ncbi:MAG TPA: universal stress protein [Gemmatimonadaceae bacterium]|nr:universal stress protein [Gemmatimonadaceae bacterium]
MTAPITTILVPLDGSELAEQALPLAIALARASDAQLHLMHVFVPYAARSDMPGTTGHTEIERQLEEQSTEYLRSVTERVAKELPDHVHADPVRTRPIRSPYSESVAVVDRLRRAVARLHPDLMVLATHARSGVGRAWLGSVADALIRRVNVPTLLVHPREGAAAPGATFSHVVVPLDGSRLAEESIPIAARLAALGNARVTLLRVVIPQLAVGHPSVVLRFNVDQLEHYQAEATRYVDSVAERFRGAIPSVESVVILAESPPRAILEWSEQNGADLIAMSTHGRSGFRRFMLGSVADKVVRGAQVPVLLTRPGDVGGDVSGA